MTIKSVPPFVATAVLLAAVALVQVRAEDGPMVSTMSMLPGAASVGGITILPAPDVTPKVYTGDLASPQVFEIIRPDMGPITVGRLHSSCTCVQATLGKRSFAAGERAFIEVRNVKATPPNGATYAVFVQFASPIRDVVQLDVFVKSEPRPISVVRAEPGSYVPINPTPSQPTVLVKGTPPAQQWSDPAKAPTFKYEDVTPYKPRAGQ